MQYNIHKCCKRGTFYSKSTRTQSYRIKFAPPIQHKQQTLFETLTFKYEKC